MSVPNNNKVRNVHNSGTRMGVHTDVNADLTTNTRVDNGGNKHLRKETNVHGGDARLKLQGSRLTGGSQHTSINMPSHPPHQSTIIIPQLTNPPATARPWADSAFGTYYVPSVRMAITVSVASTLSILLVFFLCRTYLGSKTNKMGRKFTKKANAAMEKLAGKDYNKAAENLEEGMKQWSNQGVSKTDLANGVKTVNRLVDRTSQLEQSQARQEKLLKELARRDNKSPHSLAVEDLLDDDDESDEPDFAQQRPARPRHRRVDGHQQGRREDAHPGQTQWSNGDLRTLFLNWTSHFYETSKNSSPSEEGEGQTPRRQRNVSEESSRSHDQRRTAQPSPEREGTKGGAKGGASASGYPIADLEEAWASFQEHYLKGKRQKKLCYTKDVLGLK